MRIVEPVRSRERPVLDQETAVARWRRSGLKGGDCVKKIRPEHKLELDGTLGTTKRRSSAGAKKIALRKSDSATKNADAAETERCHAGTSDSTPKPTELRTSFPTTRMGKEWKSNQTYETGPFKAPPASNLILRERDLG